MMSVEAGARLGGSRGNARKLMKHLVLVNINIVVLDITILGLEYAGQIQLQTAYKGLVYSVKLKLEISILNRLVELTTGGAIANSSARGHIFVSWFWLVWVLSVFVLVSFVLLLGL